jgi:phosphoribosylformimino-5-aminoimidazole carboxamide ribotide isomerase
MIIYPAIDIKGGAVVRLRHGDMAQATIFSDDPAAQAKLFAKQGFSWLHLVDLDGAIAGRSVNAEAVQAIIDTVDLPVQLGGGIRDRAAIDSWLAAGVNRVILGTVAMRDPELVRAACRDYPDQIAVGIDARNGFVAVEGWVESSTIAAKELALRFEDAGAAAIIFTDIDRDGALGGVNVAATVALAQAISTPVIASGGVAGIEDLRQLRAQAAHGIAGVIVGRALYDGRIDPAEALSLVNHA